MYVSHTIDENSHANGFDTIRVGWKFEELVTGCSQVYIWPRKETAPTSESKMCLPLDALWDLQLRWMNLWRGAGGPDWVCSRSQRVVHLYKPFETLLRIQARSCSLFLFLVVHSSTITNNKGWRCKRDCFTLMQSMYVSGKILYWIPTLILRVDQKRCNMAVSHRLFFTKDCRWVVESGFGLRCYRLSSLRKRAACFDAMVHPWPRSQWKYSGDHQRRSLRITI